MPGVRDQNQRHVGVHLDLQLLARIDFVCNKLGIGRSAFIRQAIGHELERYGIELSPEILGAKRPRFFDTSHIYTGPVDEEQIAREVAEPADREAFEVGVAIGRIKPVGTIAAGAPAEAAPVTYRKPKKK